MTHYFFEDVASEVPKPREMTPLSLPANSGEMFARNLCCTHCGQGLVFMCLIFFEQSNTYTFSDMTLVKYAIR